jgi:xanthine dehydrogenase iron-sulfur cluster and FAD-binding subunit A
MLRRHGARRWRAGACSVTVGDSAEQAIVTIEGLGHDKRHAVQQAWIDHDVPQCGYCQSGQIMAAAALVARIPDPSDADIDSAMTNICRCGTYPRIRAAIHLFIARQRRQSFEEQRSMTAQVLSRVGGTLKSFRRTTLKAGAASLPWFPSITGVAVVADRFWRAQQALADLPIVCDEGSAATTDSNQLRKAYVDALDGPAVVARNVGDVTMPLPARQR